MRISSSSLRVALCGIAFLTLGACTGSVADNRMDAEAFIRANIAGLSPEPAILGGSFYVTDLEWIDDDTIRVSYEDGHIALIGTTDVTFENGTMDASIIVLENEEGSMSSGASSSLSSMDDDDGSAASVMSDDDEDNDDDTASASSASPASSASAASSY